MPATYRYAAEHLLLSAGRWNEQKKNMGMLELNINRLFPGGSDILVLSLKSAVLPGRTVPKHAIEYLNGTVHYPGRPDAQGDLSCTFRDYIDSQTRNVLETWFRQVYNEQTGRMMLTNRLKTTGNLVLFGSDGITGLRRYYLYGLFPTTRPGVDVEMGDGSMAEMAISFSVDSVRAIQL